MGSLGFDDCGIKSRVGLRMAEKLVYNKLPNYKISQFPNHSYSI
jgi:hypothetical protein